MPRSPLEIVKVPPRKTVGRFSTFERRYDPIRVNEMDSIERYFHDPMVAAADENQIWTIISGDTGAWYIVPGRVFVNREYYVLTRKAWSTDELASPGYRY